MHAHSVSAPDPPTPITIDLTASPPARKRIRTYVSVTQRGSDCSAINMNTMDAEWRPDMDIDKLGEEDLRKLSSQIGVRFQKPMPSRKRSHRQRNKTTQYVPEVKLRDWRGVKEKRRNKQKAEKQIVKRSTCTQEKMNPSVKKETNVFGGVNTKKQRVVFGDKFAVSVHRPLDVYKGVCCLLYFTHKYLTVFTLNNTQLWVYITEKEHKWPECLKQHSPRTYMRCLSATEGWLWKW